MEQFKSNMSFLFIFIFFVSINNLSGIEGLPTLSTSHQHKRNFSAMDNEEVMRTRNINLRSKIKKVKEVKQDETMSTRNLAQQARALMPPLSVFSHTQSVTTIKSAATLAAEMLNQENQKQQQQKQNPAHQDSDASLTETTVIGVDSSSLDASTNTRLDSRSTTSVKLNTKLDYLLRAAEYIKEEASKAAREFVVNHPPPEGLKRDISFSDWLVMDAALGN